MIEVADADADATLQSYRADDQVVSAELDKTRDVAATPNDTGVRRPVGAAADRLGSASTAPSTRRARRRSPSSTPASTPRTTDLDGQLVAGTSVLDGSAGTTDPNGHGTAMAGIVAAATDNGTGIAGVGYAGVKVMPVTVLGADGTGQDSDVIEGVVWAADHGADVILMSFSNPGYSASLQAAIDYAWSKSVVARRRDRQRRLDDADLPGRRPRRRRRLEHRHRPTR